MLHRIHKCTNTLYDYAIIINNYVSLMYELKKMERYLRVNLLEPGPRRMKKESTWPRSHRLTNTALVSVQLPHLAVPTAECSHMANKIGVACRNICYTQKPWML